MNKITINGEKLVQKHWSTKEQENVELVIDFVQHIMNDHDYSYVREQFKESSYTQHNRNMIDGVEGVVSFNEDFTKRFPDFTYDVKKIMVDGDLVIFHSHSTIKEKDRGNDKKGMNIIDIWQIKDGQIAEHWDSIQPLDWFMRLYVLLAGGSIKNTNGVF